MPADKNRDMGLGRAHGPLDKQPVVCVRVRQEFEPKNEAVGDIHDGERLCSHGTKYEHVYENQRSNKKK